MSTNINENNLPDVRELEKLANQFFKSLQGGDANITPEGASQEYNPAGDRLNGIPGVDGFPIELFGSNSQPPSVSGIGASPSAINQGSVINLQDPQTSFEDP